MGMSKREQGKVKWFNDARGYGFIIDEEDITEQFFVHYSSVNVDGFKTLKEGQTVEFTLVQTDKGIQATDVDVIEA